MKAKPFGIIFRRELKALFLTPIAYIVIALFLVVVGWFFFSTFFLAGRADLRDFFSLLPLILAFTVPATTMRLFAEERRSGSYEILTTLPVTGVDVLLAKYASAVASLKLANDLYGQAERAEHVGRAEGFVNPWARLRKETRLLAVLMDKRHGAVQRTLEQYSERV